MDAFQWDWVPTHAGTYQYAAPLAQSTWFQAGGAADLLFKPSNLNGLSLFLSQRPSHIPYTVLGVGSNVLIRDGGVRGVVIRLASGFRTFFVDHTDVEVSAGLLDRNVAENCFLAGIGGLEFLATIPGTIGGALRMNAGAYGKEIKDCLVYATAIDPNGQVHRLFPDQMDFGYRFCGVPHDWIFMGARLRGFSDAPKAIRERMDACLRAREQTQPTRGRTGGSTFANPEGCRAWELIDRSGCRGLRVGGAVVSEKHCNFLLNTGGATAQDIETLGEEIRARVWDATGVRLRWEIQRVGEPLEALACENNRQIVGHISQAEF